MSKSKTERNIAVTAPPSKPNAVQPTKHSLSVDVDYFQSVIDDPSVSESQKREYIENLWSIVVSFVDLGFGVHPLQQARNEKHDETSLALHELINDMDWEGDELANGKAKTKFSEERKDA